VEYVGGPEEKWSCWSAAGDGRRAMFCEIDVEEMWSGSMFDAALERKASVSLGESSSSSNMERRGRSREESKTFDITR
jgi:hypothetical protein